MKKNTNKITTLVCLLLAANTAITTIKAAPARGGLAGTETLTEKQASELMKNSGTGFIKNVGQVFDMNKKPCPDVYYQYQLNEAAIFLTKTGLSFAFYKKDKSFYNENDALKKTDIISEITGRACRLDVTLANANILKQNIIEQDINYGAGKMNIYFDSFNEGNSNLYYSKKLIVKDIYPNIDWVLKMNDETGLKQEFIVHPGGNYKNIQMLYNGVNKLSLNQDKDGVFAQTDLGDVNDIGLKCFTASGKDVKSAYHLNSKNEVSIQIEKYNINEDLIIDPQIVLSRTWATYFGGNSEDNIWSNKIDLVTSQLYVAGSTLSNPFPPYSATSGSIGLTDAFVCCFALNGTKIWCNLFGSSLADVFHCVTTDGNSNVIAAGLTSCTNVSPVKYPLMPVVGGYFQSWSAPLPVFQHPDGMITKMDFNGVVSWSTIFGGAGADNIRGITTNHNNDIIICGDQYFDDYTINGVPNYFPYNSGGGYFYSLPNTVNTISSFIALFNAATQLKWSTLFKGCGCLYDVTCDVNDYIYTVGWGSLTSPELTGPAGSYQQNANSFPDAVIAKFRPTSYNLIWGTNFGGNGDDFALSCAINPADNSLFICGYIANTAVNFPFLPAGSGYFNNNYPLPPAGAAKHGFIAEFDATLKEIWATLFSGNGTDVATCVKVGSGGTIFLAGLNKRNGTPPPPDDFPRFNPGSPFYYDGAANQNNDDGYIAMFYDIRILRWSTYYGTTNCNEYSTDLDVAGRILLYTGYADNDPNQSMITTQQEVGTSWLQTAQGFPSRDGIIAKFYNQYNQNLKESENSLTPAPFYLYRNPISNGEVTLFINNASINYKASDFELVDMLGEKIKVNTFSQNGNELILKFNNLTDGVFILKAKTVGGIQTFKIINHE